MVERNRNGPFHSPAVLQLVGAVKENPDSWKRKLKLLQKMAVGESKLDLSKAHN